LLCLRIHSSRARIKEIDSDPAMKTFVLSCDRERGVEVLHLRGTHGNNEEEMVVFDSLRDFIGAISNTILPCHYEMIAMDSDG